MYYIRHNQHVSWESVFPVYLCLPLFTIVYLTFFFVPQVPLPWREEEPWSFCLTGLVSAKVLFVMFLGCKATLFERVSEYFIFGLTRWLAMQVSSETGIRL